MSNGYGVFFLDRRRRGYYIASRDNSGKVWYTSKSTSDRRHPRQHRRRGLPARRTELEALRDLAAYAKRKGWAAVGDRSVKNMLHWRD